MIYKVKNAYKNLLELMDCGFCINGGKRYRHNGC
jgi:hypothetical protein